MTETTSRKYVIVSTRDDLLITQEITHQLAKQVPSSEIFVVCPSPCIAGAQIWVDKITSRGEGSSSSPSPLPTKVQVLPFDPYGDRATCRRASKELIERLGDTTISGIIMNWQGCLPGRFGIVLDESGMLEMAQIKILSQLFLIESLIEKKLIVGNSGVVVSGSEAARGIEGFRFQPPTMGDTLESYVSILNGSGLDLNSGNTIYAHVQGILSLYIASLARKHPSIKFWTLSPGFTQDSMNENIQIEENPPAYKFEDVLKAGIAQDYTVAATNFVHAVLGSSEWDYPSGALVAAAKGVNGDLCDQAELENGKYLADHSKQDLAYQALHTFM